MVPATNIIDVYRQVNWVLWKDGKDLNSNKRVANNTAYFEQEEKGSHNK